MKQNKKNGGVCSGSQKNPRKDRFFERKPVSSGIQQIITTFPFVHPISQFDINVND